MARALRIEFKSALYHITARGNEGRNIFKDSEDYEMLLKIFREAETKYGLILRCYSLMPNHYHLVMETPDANLTKGMHFIQTSYTIYFNRKYRRIGHLFQGRYKALLVDKDNYLLELSRYVHLNPLRANLVERLEDYEWSSYLDYIGLRDSKLVETETVLKQFSAQGVNARKKYREFCYQGKGIEWKRFKKEIYAGIILGRKEFTQKMKEKIKGLKLSKEIPSSRKLAVKKSKDKILELVSIDYGKEKDEILKEKGEPRKLAIYLLRKYTDMDLQTIVSLFGKMHYSSISKIVSRFRSEINSNKILNERLRRIESKI